MARLGYKCFATSVRDQEKYTRLHSKVLRLLVLMDAMKGAAAYEVAMVNENEPNTSINFNLEGVHLHVESVLSLFLPTWFLLVMIVGFGLLCAWLVREFRMSCVRKLVEDGYGMDEDGALFEQPHGEGDDQGVRDVRDGDHGVRDVHDGDQHGGVRDVRGGDPHEGLRDQRAELHHQQPQQPHQQPAAAVGAVVAFPELRFCPGYGQVYHKPGCGCLRAASRVSIYTADHRQRLHLAPAGNAGPACFQVQTLQLCEDERQGARRLNVGVLGDRCCNLHCVDLIVSHEPN